MEIAQQSTILILEHKYSQLKYSETTLMVKVALFTAWNCVDSHAHLQADRCDGLINP